MARKPEKLKILFTIPNFDTAGSGKALLKVAQRLNPERFVPEILCLHDRGAFFKVVKESGIPVHMFQYTTQMKPYKKGLIECYKISKKLKKINPDIIHSFHYASDYSEPLAAKLAGIKWVYTKKNMNWGGASKNSWKLRTWLAKRILVQNTDMLRDFFPENKNTDLVPRGVDITEFYPFIPKVDIKEKLNFKSSDRIIICVANLVPIKGVEVLINAFSNVTDKGNWKLIVVGENNNDYGKELASLVEKLKMQEDIIFIGKVLNVKDYLNTSEIFVLPTLNKGRREGSPVSLLEAMACGLNVLGSNIPGIKDQLFGFSKNLFEAGNIKELTEKLQMKMQNTTEKNKRQGHDFKEYIDANYTIDHEVERTEKVYLKC